MKPKHLLLMAIVGLAATSCQSTNNSGSVVGSVSDESSVSSPDSTTSDSTPAEPTRSVAAAISAGYIRGSRVKSGTISIVEGEDKSEITYDFGEDSNGDFFHYHEKNAYLDEDYYVVNDADEKKFVFYVDVETKEVSKPWNFDDYDFAGYTFDGLIDYSSTYYGVEDLVYSLYVYGVANHNRDFVDSSDGEKFSFSFGNGDEYGLDYFTVAFSLSSTNVFSNVELKIDNYASSSIVVDDVYHNVTLQPNATPAKTTTFTINQVEGDRNATNPYVLENFYFTSFDLSETGSDGAALNLADAIVLEASSSLKFKIINPLPATASAGIDDVETEIIEEEEEDGISVNFSSYYNELTLSANEVGSYKFSVSTKNVTKTLTVTVTPATAKSVSVVVMTQGVNNSNGSAQYNSNTYIGSEPLNLYAGDEIALSVGITPSVVVDTISFDVTGGEEANISVQNGTITQWGSPKDVIKVSSSVIGSYKIKVWPTNAPTIFKEVDINVVAKPALVDYISGSFATKRYNEINNEVVFTPTDATTGSVSITTSGGTEVASYVISDATQTGAYDVALTHVSGASLEASIKIGPDFSVVLYTGGSSYGTTLNKSTDRFVYSGSYDTVIGDATYILNLNVNGEFTLSYNSTDGWGSVTGGWTLVTRPAGGFFINFSASYYTEAGQTMLNFADDTSYIDGDGNVHVNILVGGTSTACAFRLIPAEELM